jgi:hypothetical protein
LTLCQWQDFAGDYLSFAIYSNQKAKFLMHQHFL